MHKSVNPSNTYYERLNKSDAIVFKDYLTLLKEGLLLDIKFSDIDNMKVSFFDKKKEEEIGGDEIKRELFKRLEIREGTYDSEKKMNKVLFERIYTILRNIMNHPLYSSHDITIVVEEALKESFKKLKIKGRIDNKIVAIFVELNKSCKILTRLDLMSIRGESEEDLRENLESQIYSELQIDRRSPNAKTLALEKINKLYETSLYKMRHNFGLKIPKTYKTKSGEVILYDKKWKSIDEFISFMLTTSHTNEEGKQVEGYSRLINCAITKTMTAYSEIMDNPLVESLNEILNEIIGKLEKIPGAGNTYKKNGEIVYYFNSPDLSESHFKCRITYRTKASAKILMKLLYNRKYTKLDFLKDLIGFRVEVYDTKNGKAATEFIIKHLFEGKVMIDNKGFFDNEIIKDLKQKLEIEERGKSGKGTTSEDFINLSLCGNIKGIKKAKGIDKFPPVEVQLVYTGNQNESGMNKHEIYDTKKLISVISRLFGYITLEQVKLIIHEIGLTSGEEERYILEHLFIKKNINGKNNKPYILKLEIPENEIKTTTGKKENINLYISKDVFSSQLNDLYGKEIIAKELEEKDLSELIKAYNSIKL